VLDAPGRSLGTTGASKRLDAIESARPDGAARDTGFVRLRDAQQRGMVMANASDTKASEMAANETGRGRDCIVAAELAANGGQLTEEQREALVARVAARDASFWLTEQRALAAVDEARAVLSKLDWACTVLAMVMVFEGRTVGGAHDGQGERVDGRSAARRGTHGDRVRG
jgi:hypothetical protein